MPTAQAQPAAGPARLKRRWQQADFEQRRRLILEAAMDLLHRHGAARVTIRRVAQRLGVGAMTLYTYYKGQDELRTEMTREGFRVMHEDCNAHSTLGSEQGWRGGARHYIDFAVRNPNLYELMFSTPMVAGSPDQAILEGGFQLLIQRVTERLATQGLRGEELDRRAHLVAGRFWVALHGIASLAIAGRLGVIQHNIDQLLDEMLPRVQPDDGR